MFAKENIDLSTAGTLDDLEGFVHPVWGRMKKGTGIGYIPGNLIFSASGELVGGSETKPEQYDGIIKVFATQCTDEQSEKIREIIHKIIEENQKNKARQPENPGKGFTYHTYDLSTQWGSAMIALCKHFKVELPS